MRVMCRRNRDRCNVIWLHRMIGLWPNQTQVMIYHDNNLRQLIISCGVNTEAKVHNAVYHKYLCSLFVEHNKI